ncbi:hypothetical protein LR007_03025 [candidate division NPL-UPA2 bacterium]|nr:hypothetical protein [candidate division NPL-UPA2 bacterium]
MLIREISLTYEDYLKAVKFALKLWFAGKAIGDWRAARRRDLGKYITDHASGKLAEIAFCRFLEANWNLKAEADFEVYPGARAIDKGDIACIEIDRAFKMPPPIDVKATKPGSEWAFVELREFKKRAYWIYVWILVDLPLAHLAKPVYEAVRNKNLAEIETSISQLADQLKEIEAVVSGFKYREELEAEGREFKRGDEVPDPEDPSRSLFTAGAGNIGVPIADLRNSESDWKELIEKLKAWSR